MAHVSVVEAAERLGVGVSRIHQRIAEGSLRADRIGSQWVVDELSMLRVAESRSPGRPLSARSAWAVIAASEGAPEAVVGLAPAERARAAARLRGLFDLAEQAAEDEAGVRSVARALRAVLKNRADRRLCSAAAADLPGLGADARWQAQLDSALSGIGSAVVEGYVAEDDVGPLAREHLVAPSGEDGNVVLHVVPAGMWAFPDSKLQFAADLAEHRRPREELRAVELVRELAAAQG